MKIDKNNLNIKFIIFKNYRMSNKKPSIIVRKQKRSTPPTIETTTIINENININNNSGSSGSSSSGSSNSSIIHETDASSLENDLDKLVNIYMENKDIENKELIDIFNNLYKITIKEKNTNKTFKFEFSDFKSGIRGKALLDKKIYTVQYRTLILNKLFLKNNILNDNSEIYNKSYIILFNKIYEWIHYTIPEIQGKYHKLQLSDDSYESSMNTDTSFFRFIPHDMSTYTPYQKLLRYCIDTISANGYRRYNKELYKRCYIDGNFTYSWEKVFKTMKNISSMECFIQSITDYHTHNEQWKWRTPKNLKDVALTLETSIDHELIELKKDRNIFSFKNGVYITKIIRNGKYDHYFYKYGTGKCQYLNENSVAVNYIDSNFEFKNLEEWKDIKIPIFQKIFDHQFKKETDYNEIYELFYGILGRLLYNVNELDNWQIVPFLKGVGGTGKGMIIKFIGKIYNDNDVGTLGDNVESSFGLFPLSNKLLVVAPEIAEIATNLKQSVFQSMVSGENVNTPIKGINGDGGMLWKIPMILAGNCLPNYIDNSQSLLRRYFVFPFMVLVPAHMKDSQLESKLDSELANFLQKINCAYLYLLNKLGNSDIKTILPKYFLDTVKDVSTDTNSFNQFLESEKVEYNPNYYCHPQEFYAIYKEHCRQNSIKVLKWNRDMYSGILQQITLDKGFDVIVEKKFSERVDSNGIMKKGKHIVGMRLVVEHNEE